MERWRDRRDRRDWKYEKLTRWERSRPRGRPNYYMSCNALYNTRIVYHTIKRDKGDT